VSSSDSLWAATSESATAPLDAFAVLASRNRSDTRIGRLDPTLDTPAVYTRRYPPAGTTTIAPGGPSGIRTTPRSSWSRQLAGHRPLPSDCACVNQISGALPVSASKTASRSLAEAANALA
jgi:hypothetical protein